MNRRTLLALSAAAAMPVAPFAVGTAVAEDQAPSRSPQFEDALAKLLAGRTPAAEGVNVEIPEMAENGNFVPIAIDVASPMTDDDHVAAIHILSSSNPTALVATFHLSPLNGRARVQSRMRLARTQDVVVLAETSKGAVAIASAPVNVSIGGCEG